MTDHRIEITCPSCEDTMLIQPPIKKFLICGTCLASMKTELVNGKWETTQVRRLVD